jgi:hypothetical protein
MAGRSGTASSTAEISSPIEESETPTVVIDGGITAGGRPQPRRQ